MYRILVFSVIIVIMLIGYFLPKKYNDYFYNKYYEKAVSTPLAIATAVSFSLWLLLMDMEGFWYWALLVVSVLLCIISVIYVVYIGTQVRAGVFEIVFAIVTQLLATAGVVILIIVFIAAIMGLLDKSKKRKR